MVVDGLWIIHLFFFFKQKTAYEMRISDWSSDVCSSDLSRPSNHLGYVNGALEGRDWLMGKELTGADIQMSFVGEVARAFGQTERYPNQIGRASCRERVCQYV